MRCTKILIATSFLTTIGIASAQTKLGEANLFVCKNAKDHEILFTTTSVLGTPTLSIDGRNAHNGLTVPKVQQSEMGLQITARDTLIADAGLAYTLIIPNTLVDATNHATVKAFFVMSYTGGFLPGPRPGAQQSNQLETMTCSAKRVFF